MEKKGNFMKKFQLKSVKMDDRLSLKTTPKYANENHDAEDPKLTKSFAGIMMIKSNKKRKPCKPKSSRTYR